MRTIGLIGGMSWESSAEYYRLLNQGARQRLGGFHSARTLMASVDFADIEGLQSRDAWEEAGRLLAATARSLERGGAELVVLCTNTMHQVATAIEEATALPFLHIADATADAAEAAGIERLGLLGTRYTMERAFYRGRLEARGIEVLVPDEPDRTTVHDVIYHELVLGRLEDASRVRYRDAMAQLVERGAQGVILGCTEISLLVGPDDASVPLLDTTRIHAARALEMALAP